MIMHETRSVDMVAFEERNPYFVFPVPCMQKNLIFFGVRLPNGRFFKGLTSAGNL